ncbi:hypothetical protein [Algoriphagus halophilus]|uniref:Uncharacterized protein n=1 Tax=Algoriphagus halophilus TaxID=226505 RepID=A0A1N6DPY1_9BACT|nr:hypothetical protein [Algoriphagus halophilus]SIN72859.1 hypothetical protein SAMN05444394_1247 [Algoriphagus halophilus]
MKDLFSFLLLSSFLFFSCAENEEDPVLKVTYEVITTGGAEWYGEFDDENGERINSFDLNSGLLSSGWKYEFEPKVSPITLTIHGTTNCPTCGSDSQRLNSEDITVNIYINDKLVQTETNTCRECTIPPIKGMATAWMKLPEELE